MIRAAGGGREVATETLRRILWSHPEWWCIALSVSAWGLMAAHMIGHHGDACHHRESLYEAWLNWLAMIAAMMVPLELRHLRKTAFSSLRTRRHRAMIGFLLGFIAPWGLLGIVAAWLCNQPWGHGHAPAAVAFAFATLWVTTPLRARALVSCHRTVPLAPSGWRANVDCVRFGSLVGTACTTTCWPFMIACALSGHSPIAMAGGAALGAIERLSFRPRYRTILAGAGGLTIVYLALALYRA